jgi:hypothetical protein
LGLLNPFDGSCLGHCFSKVPQSLHWIWIDGMKVEYAHENEVSSFFFPWGGVGVNEFLFILF